MPYYQEYCEPELVLTLPEGTKIYRDYKGGDLSQPLTCWYQLRDEKCSGCWVSFDVRDLPPDKTDRDQMRTAAHAAQEAGLSFLAYLRSQELDIFDAYG